jgi:hypothetical protein
MIHRVLQWTLLALLFAQGSAAGSPLAVASLVGGPGDDEVVGARVLADGTVVLAVSSGGSGAVVRISGEGDKVLSTLPVRAGLRDMAADGQERIYVAAGDAGVIVVDPNTMQARGTLRPGHTCERVDVASDGHVAVLGGTTVSLIAPNGRVITQIKGKGYTTDVAINGASQTVIVVGFTNNRAHDGTRTFPVQIAYVWGFDYAGKRKYTLYDWSPSTESDRFLNRPENNMADTRAYRAAIGRDGKLYVAFEAAGGNHIFRYTTTDIMTKFKLVGGDAHHSFHNSRSEHKTVFGRYEPATGEALAIQQFCGRLSNGRANAVSVSSGEITADEHGRVYLVGKAAAGLPLTYDPPGAGDYTGGAFVLVMSPDLRDRLLCTRIGGGAARAVDARSRGNNRLMVFAGQGPKPEEPIHLHNPLSSQRAGLDGFFVFVK